MSISVTRALRGHVRVLIDTSVWIYHFGEHEQFGAQATKVIELIEAGRVSGVGSELSLLELAVKPLQLGRQDVADEIELLVSRFPNFELIPVTREILLTAAALRARYHLKTPDAILVATGLQAGATAAVTNDSAWRGVADIEVIVLADLT